MDYDKLINIPIELREINQWCVTNIRDKIPLSYSLNCVSIHDKHKFLSFLDACRLAFTNKLAVGFILSETDPFTCIDLDYVDANSQIKKGQKLDPAKWTKKEDYNRYWGIINSLNSYSEVSASGKGIHIWVYGNIGKGMRRDNVEVYSQERFIICTGNHILQTRIKDCQHILDNMQSQMRVANNKTVLTEVPQEFEDSEIIKTAINASNSEKFIDLYSGNWQKYGFPSQSEADLALMSMFTFYSKSNEQCKRLFRLSELGKREKAVKNDRYLNFTLEVIRGREEIETEIRNSASIQSLNLVNKLQGTENKQPKTFLHSQECTTEESKLPAPGSVTFSKVADDHIPVVTEGDLDFPPGFAGVIARYIYASSARPVREISIVATLGLLCGICGKAWSITQSGLNMYIIVIAQSGVGKEDMHKGVSSLMSACSKIEPRASNFFDFSDFASGPALSKAVADNPCFVNVAGEWGRKLVRLAKETGNDIAMQTLRTVMTNLYQKSGPQSVVGGLKYSNKADNIDSVTGVSYSMIGETTPETFYESLTSSMMSDGFLSRFTHVQYEGIRVPLNLNKLLKPDDSLTMALAELCYHSSELIQRGITTNVNRTPSVAETFARFEIECDNQINSTQDEMWRQMWNRASLKVMKFSALLAVADNFLDPVITDAHVEWALALVRKDIELFKLKIESGDIGLTDDSREKKILKIIEGYLKDPLNGCNSDMKHLKKAGIISRKYLQQKTASLAAFRKFLGGSTKALNDAIKSLLDSGYLIEVDRVEAIKAFNFHGKIYRIIAIK